MIDYDVVIIGGGPAGMAAGIYAARARAKTLIIEKAFLGGLMALTEAIENYPGFSLVSGMELAKRMTEQVNNFGVETRFETVTEIGIDNRYKIVKTNAETYHTKALIVGTGASPKMLGIAGEERLRGRGVSYCATCDGAFFRNKELVVIGGGNSAVEEAIFLTKFASKVYIIHRRNAFRASAIAQERALANEKISVIWDTVPEAIEGEKRVEKIQLLNVKTREKSELKVSGVFIYVGYNPVNGFLKNLVKLDESGYIIVNEKMETSQVGIYAVGDVIRKELRQVVTAVSDGAISAFMAEKYLESFK